MSQDQQTDVLLDATTALIPPLLAALEIQGRAARHLHPPAIGQIIEQVSPYAEPLEQGLVQFAAVEWPEHLQGFSDCATESARLALKSFAELASAPQGPNETMGAYRALGFSTKATEALYPLTQMLPPVSRYFLLETHREDEALNEKLAACDPSREGVGVMHAANSSGERGGCSFYVPEWFDGESLPLVVALHGGSGHGRNFLWSWVRTARSMGAVVVSPTSADRTWSLMGPDQDSERLDALVAYAREQWGIDASKVLLTGMSDGGTFSYVSGLREGTAFTHLAPCSASFHPMLLEMAPAERLQGLPVYLMHGALDWMFDVEMARQAEQSFTAHGADVTYREIADLSHTYPVEENPRVLQWLLDH